jgi:hypothetical protein
MRLENWHSHEIFRAIEDRAMDNANAVIDEVVEQARVKCPVDPVTFREGKFSKAHVEFIPKTGSNKGKLVSFDTESRWMGRQPGCLKDTIRRVNSRDVTKANVRAYAGTFKIYWALMMEKTGYTDRGGKFHPPLHFLQSPFQIIKNTVVDRIKNGGSL